MEEKKKRGRPRKITSPEALEAAETSRKSLGIVLSHPDVHNAIMDHAKAIGIKFKDPAPSNGQLAVTDPIAAAALARHPMCASAKKEVPFPENWDKLGKIEKLQWLTAHKR